MADIPVNDIIVVSTFFLIPTLGEIYAERSGVLNLGIEGMVISSAAFSYYMSFQTGSAYIGIISGILLGMALSAIHATLTITFRRNQIVSGIALTIFGTGLSGLLGRTVVSKRDVSTVDPMKIPLLSDLPFYGDIIFNQDLIVYFGYIAVPVLWFILFKTKIGIIIRTVGENPTSAHNQGVNVNQVRFYSVLFGGAMAGIGGAYISLAWQTSWSEGMTNGQGWLVIALVIVALWNPILALFASYAFGTLFVYQFKFQSGVTIFGSTFDIPTAFISMIPFVATIIFLAIGTILISRSKVKRIVGAPSALTVPFHAD